MRYRVKNCRYLNKEIIVDYALPNNSIDSWDHGTYVLMNLQKWTAILKESYSGELFYPEYEPVEDNFITGMDGQEYRITHQYNSEPGRLEEMGWTESTPPAFFNCKCVLEPEVPIKKKFHRVLRLYKSLPR